MNDKHPNTFNLYTKNSNVISLLVHLEGNKVSTRALVWKLDGQGGVDYFVDRIYSNDDPIKKIGGIEKFMESKFPGKKYAIKQKNEDWISGVDIILKLKYLDFTLYPYLDTFSFLYFPHENLNTNSIFVKLNTSGGFLSNTKEWERYPGYLCFRLRDYQYGTKEPFNCNAIYKNWDIYHYLDYNNVSISDILYFLKETDSLDYDKVWPLITRVNNIFQQKTRDYKNFNRDEIIFQIWSKLIWIDINLDRRPFSPDIEYKIYFDDKKYYVKILQKFKDSFYVGDLHTLLLEIVKRPNSKDIIETMALSLDEGLSIWAFLIFDYSLGWSLSDKCFNRSGFLSEYRYEQENDTILDYIKLQVLRKGVKNHRLYFNNFFSFYFTKKVEYLCEYMSLFDMDSDIEKKLIG